MSVADALRMMNAGLDYLNGPGADELDAAACGSVLRSLAAVQAKFTAAHALVLARFDAADAHDCDGYGNSAAWLMAMTDMTRQDARVEMRQMRLLRDHPEMAAALAAKDISKSWAMAIAEWTKKLPAELRAETIKILVEAAAAGASRDDLRIIAAVAEQKWRSSRPDADDDGFDDRYVQVGTTFQGAGVIRGNLTPECAAAVQAVLEALGKKAGLEDVRTEGQRFHDALLQGCELLIGAKMVPDRAGADTHVAVHIPFPELRQRPGAPEAEEVWLRGTAGETGYLLGKDAEAAACDARTTPVVTGHADMRVVDKIIALALAAAGITLDGADPAGDDDDDDDDNDASLDNDSSHRSWGTAVGGPRAASRARLRARERFTPDAAQALRYAIARLAIDFVSGPAGMAGWLRTTLLAPPYSTPSLPLDIGYPTPSRPASAAPSSCGTGAAPGRGAGDPPPGATCTTCSTRPTAGRLPSATACCCASSTTTCASTAAAGGSSCIPTAPPPPTDPTGRCCTATHHPPSAPGRARLASWNRPALPAPAAVI